MDRSIVFVHWDETERSRQVKPLEEAGYNVRATLENPLNPDVAKPSVLVISLDEQPSAGGRVAEALWCTEWGKKIPIVFLDGERENVAEMRVRYPFAEYARSDDLMSVLRRFQ